MMLNWSDLKSRAEARPTILSLFEADDTRAEAFSIVADDLLFDYSKTQLDEQIQATLIALAQEAGVEARREAMFTGAKINETDDALHRSGYQAHISTHVKEN